MQEFHLKAVKKLGYSIDEVSQILPFGKTSIYSFIRSGRLPSLMICGRRVVTDDGIRKFLADAQADFDSLNSGSLVHGLTKSTSKE
jgi:hypothetical protein